MIKTDSHLHSSFSGDSNEEMETTILEAINKGMSQLCFTEHMDMDFPPNDKDPADLFVLDTDSYLEGFNKMKEKYGHKINLCFGVELGMQPHLSEIHSSYVNQFGFDFVIGSEHTTNRKDPYFRPFYDGRSEYEAYLEYFEDIVTNLDAVYKTENKFIDSLGHLDYVVRYGPTKNQNYSYSRYGDVLDEILRRLIDRGIALEINSGGYRHLLGEPNPSKEIIKRYKELGGELITIGSDAHVATALCYEFERMEALLKECGYKYYAFYQNRRPQQIPL